MNERRKRLLELPVSNSKAILDASFTLSKDGLRLLKMASQQMLQRINDDGWYFVKVSDYAEIFNLTVHEASRDVRGGLDDIWNNEININLIDDVLTKRFVIDKAERKKHGEYGFRFHPDLLPYIHDLTAAVGYSLSEVVNIRAPYPMRFYDWFSASVGSDLELSIAYIQDRLQLPDSYNKYSNLKARVIEPALSMINDLTPLCVESKEIKDGKAVVAVRFSISRKLDRIG